MNVAIQTNPSSQIGTGHFMRCLTLVDGLKEHGALMHASMLTISDQADALLHKMQNTTAFALTAPIAEWNLPK